MVLGGRFRPAQFRQHADRIARPEPLQPVHQRRADAGHPALHDRRAAARSERAVLERRRSPSGRPAAARFTTACSSSSTSASRTAICSARPTRSPIATQSYGTISQPRQLLRELRSDRRAPPAEPVGARRFARERAAGRHLRDVEPRAGDAVHRERGPRRRRDDDDADSGRGVQLLQPRLRQGRSGAGGDAQFNTQYAGKRDARGQTIPSLALPADYEFGDSFSSQDLRVTKTFNFRRAPRSWRSSSRSSTCSTSPTSAATASTSVTRRRSACRPIARRRCSARAARGRSRSADGLRSEREARRTSPGAAAPGLRSSERL